VLFAGDDVTDETAFARLRPGDVGVKVGPGDTAAQHRVDAPQDIPALLRQLVETRRG
jgi:trehalose 6-phosphate phosphatase